MRKMAAVPQLSHTASFAKPVDPSSIPNHLWCSSCGNIVFNSYQSPHGCRLCQHCIDTKLNDNEKIRCPGKTEACSDEEFPDDIMVSKENCFPDIATRREIGKLSVHCPNANHGCTETFQWKQIDQHLVNCDYQLMKCDLCKEDVMKMELDQHMQMQCRFREYVCKLCKQSITFDEYETVHKNLESANCCPKFQANCPHCNDTTVGKLTRKQYQQHLNVCKEKPDECKFAYLGCTYRANKQQLNRHYEEHLHDHLVLLYDEIIKYKNTGSGLSFSSPSAPSAAAAAAAAAGGVSSSPAPPPATAAAASQSDSEFDKVTRNFSLMYEMFKKLQINVANWAHTAIEFKELADKHGGVLKLKDFMQSVAEKIDRLPANAPAPAAAPAAATAITTQQHVAGLNTQLASLQRHVSDIDFRLKNLETTSYDGCLIWKFPNFAIRRREAIERRVASVFSQPFFDKHFGHQFRIRVNLNGDTGVEGNYLSVALVVMQSQYDDINEWPLNGQVQFRLYNLNNRNQDVVKTIAIVDGKKPQNRDDISVSWCEKKFIKLNELEAREKFVRADCLYIGADVELTSSSSNAAAGVGGGSAGGGSGKKGKKR